MRGIFLLLLFITPILTQNKSIERSEKIDTKRLFQSTIEIKPKPIENLIEALIQVESSGDSLAVGDTHLGSPSIGVLQIRPVMVKEVNRILELQGCEERYKLSDRKSRTKSISMFMIWKNYHHPLDSPEVVARNWNGGPLGYKRKSTYKYWVKVKKYLKE